MPWNPNKQTWALANDFAEGSEWQYVSSRLQDSPQYSGRSQWCYSFDGLLLSNYFKVTIGITATFMVHSLFLFFQFSSKVLVLIFLFAIFQFHPVVSWNGKVHFLTGSSSPCTNLLVTVPSAPIMINISITFFYILLDFHTIVCRWSFTGVWVTATSLPKSLRPFIVFWLILTIYYYYYYYYY